jgi:MprA protease rhombosortase-interaction domain-containing protein
MVVGLVAAGLASSAWASVYSTGFEAPIALGTLVGQDGWVAGSGTGLSQAVTANFARTGAQSLSWENTDTTNSFYSVRRPMSPQNGAITAATPLEISTWLYVEQGTGLDRVYGIYAMNTATSTLGGTNLGITISGNGTIRAGTTWSATYSGTGLSTDASLVGAWVQLVLLYDGVGGAAKVFNSGGTEVFSTTFASVTLGNANSPATNWGVNLGSDYNGTTARLGRAFMDDVSVRVVPTPGALLALAGGLAFGVRRRRA